MINEVRAWEESIVIPTYPVGVPEKNPLFLEKRVYQGSSGVVYPHAVIEKIFDEKVDKQYRAVFLENQYIKVMILPELGGRIQMAFDKVKKRHFVYYNQVIKPALVGLTGPWISGGIEFNWPQHHRPSTFEPVDYTIKENEDGSKTVWVNEIERMFRTKGRAGFTLYKDKAYIEISGKVYNRTPFPQSFLWWANPAVKVNDAYQSVFPPDVYAVFDHGKRDVSSFPIANGVYYKVDYSPGTDISRYKNIPVPTSYMAVSSRYDFVGGYEHDTRAGLLHVADHHISPGKKQWTWGHGPFGQAWDRNLTDEDGPYIELMTGVFTDNQPDFSWLQPFEEKSFVQYFMPYAEVGLVKNATKEALVALESAQGELEVRLYVTSVFPELEILVSEAGHALFSDVIAASPASPYRRRIACKGVEADTQLEVVVTDLSTGKVLVRYLQELPEEQDVPSPAQAAKRPEAVESNEQLFLTGLHLEQYRHATYSATEYYEEALKRDAGDVRNNNALGLWYLRRGRFAISESYFRRAIATLSERNPNPYDGGPYYNLGWSLKMQGKNAEAFDVFYKATWNDAYQHAAYLELGRLACGEGDFEKALALTELSLIKDYHSHTVRHIKTALLRKLGRYKEALTLADESLKIDAFNYGCLFERGLLLEKMDSPEEAIAAFETLKQVSRNWVHNFLEYAIDYSQAGLFEEAIALLQLHLERNEAVYPMVYYYLGWFSHKLGKSDKAMEYFRLAAALDPRYCFPNRIEDVPILQAAMEKNPADPKAPYYLGNFWYDKRQHEEAIRCWELSVEADDTFPTAHRNLSLAYFNKAQQPAKALANLERAFSLDTTDARVFMELDQLYKRMNMAPEKRLELFLQYPDLVDSRDDLYLERISIYNLLGEYERARNLILAHKFHPWEGGEGKVVSQYLLCQTELAKRSIIAGNLEEALQFLQETEIYPLNLGEGKLPGSPENDIHYLKGMVFEQNGDMYSAKQYYTLATKGASEPVQAVFYNDPQPDKIFYQGLAWLKLGAGEKGEELFMRLIDFGEKHLNDHIEIDYFAVSLPDLLVFDADLDSRNKIHCLYLVALGRLGLGAEDPAQLNEAFNRVLALDGNHQGATVHRRMVGFLWDSPVGLSSPSAVEKSIKSI